MIVFVLEHFQPTVFLAGKRGGMGLLQYGAKTVPPPLPGKNRYAISLKNASDS